MDYRHADPGCRSSSAVSNHVPLSTGKIKKQFDFRNHRRIKIAPSALQLYWSSFDYSWQKQSIDVLYCSAENKLTG